MRRGNTGREMLASGAWEQVKSKHYRHFDGGEISYDGNHWVWRTSLTGQRGFSALWIALEEFERVLEQG